MTERSLRVMIVDDEEVLRDVLEVVLRREGFDVVLAASGEEALNLLDGDEVDLVILDVMLPGISGIDTLRAIRIANPTLPVVVITAFSSIDGAIEAMKFGAFHYIPKPFKNEEVVLTVNKALEQRRLSWENERLKAELSEKYSYANIIGKSESMRKVFELIRLAAPSRSNILITGESGTGKELVAKAIHHASPRAKNAFVTVNSGSLPPELLESSLFGHLKGAFTGAIATKRGLFEVADGGSIFLDEIGNINLETQAKLLRVIQEKEFMRLGSVETIRVDCRIIAATNADLTKLMADSRFREDLFYRLNVITIPLPPLRRKREDIPLLVAHFMQKYSDENRRKVKEVTPDAMRILLDHLWPGNVRELENTIERAVVLSTGDRITPELLPDSLRYPVNTDQPSMIVPSEGLSLKDAVSRYERAMILQSLEMANGVQKRAAELLQVKPSTLNEMMKRLGIHSKSTAGVEEEVVTAD
ncbi:MAG TPA: sigma-54 dependent transcriptional regulator [Thermoanaerobaculia bacterium]|jgi:two-component system response regulator PilR (NtrC family)|nr:sigma-54 dependent transcriptional regulator [Thermoanaerobaculia bacterium]